MNSISGDNRGPMFELRNYAAQNFYFELLYFPFSVSIDVYGTGLILFTFSLLGLLTKKISAEPGQIGRCAERARPHPRVALPNLASHFT